MPRCLASLEQIPVEGLTIEAQRLLSGGEGPFPHRLEYRRRDLLIFRAKVAEHMSISGVQDKVSLRLVNGRLEPTDTEGEYILKPIPMTIFPSFTEDLPANEHLTMLLADRVFGIEVPAFSLVRLADDELAYLVKRFDKIDGERIPQEDFSQLMAISPVTHGQNYKYESSYEEVGEALARLCPPTELPLLFVRIVFCFAVSNGDAHLKNFSVYKPDPAGPSVLTPAYDLVCSSLHVPDETRLALPLFRDGEPGQWEASYGFEVGGSFLDLASRFGLPESLARRLLEPFLASNVREAVESLVRRSFLSEEAKIDYIDLYSERQRMLRLGLAS